ncbi:hypothetical protein TNCV_2681111 [Trichonephila clavipes]|uniref:Uncharacterized protein n=1 Tax=Trichonephila clavipes TaxID=2585209 RepID=A0A8X6VHL1_TRICX|nr:hypothetical protein TNCV_2681111 [Trichonephila clavipes]
MVLFPIRSDVGWDQSLVYRVQVPIRNCRGCGRTTLTHKRFKETNESSERGAKSVKARRSARTVGSGRAVRSGRAAISVITTRSARVTRLVRAVRLEKSARGMSSERSARQPKELQENELCFTFLANLRRYEIVLSRWERVQ